MPFKIVRNDITRAGGRGEAMHISAQRSNWKN